MGSLISHVDVLHHLHLQGLYHGYLLALYVLKLVLLVRCFSKHHFAACSSSSEWRHSTTDSGYPTKADEGLGAILNASSPRFYFLFSFLSRDFLTSGLFSWCNLFLMAYSSNFLTCSKAKPVKAAPLTCRHFNKEVLQAGNLLPPLPSSPLPTPCCLVPQRVPPDHTSCDAMKLPSLSVCPVCSAPILLLS